jgi:hypothetical protein
VLEQALEQVQGQGLNEPSPQMRQVPKWQKTIVWQSKFASYFSLILHKQCALVRRFN